MAINPKQAIFARLVASGETAVSAYALAYPKAKKTSVRAAAARLAHHPGVRAEIARLQEAAGKEAVLSIAEKRAWCAKVLKTPVGQVDENSPLAQEVSYVEGKNGATKKVKMVNKIAALELDNKLAGHDYKDQPLGKDNPFLMLVGICGNSRDDDDDETTTIEAEAVNS